MDRSFIFLIQNIWKLKYWDQNKPCIYYHTKYITAFEMEHSEREKQTEKGKVTCKKRKLSD